MAIRPRTEGVWHSYRKLYDDLRSGFLTYAEYDIMIQEDHVESERRKSVVAGGIEWQSAVVGDKPTERWQEVRELLIAAESLVSQARLKTETIILTPYRDEPKIESSDALRNA